MLNIKQGYKFIYIEIENLKLFLLLIALAAAVGTFLAWSATTILITPFVAIGETVGTPEVTITTTPPPQKSEVELEIARVFGDDAGKAFLLLRGKGEGTCAENRGLDPKAVHKNRDGSRDYGLFQLNNYWNGFRQHNRNELLLDYRVNTAIAYRLYEDSGNKFSLWSCGKVYGI